MIILHKIYRMYRSVFRFSSDTAILKVKQEHFKTTRWQNRLKSVYADAPQSLYVNSFPRRCMGLFKQTFSVVWFGLILATLKSWQEKQEDYRNSLAGGC